MQKTLVTTLIFVAALLIAGNAFAKGPMGSGDFKVYSQDDQGGGWVLHEVAAKGTLLWGCKDVAVVETCEFVAIPHFMPGTKLEFIHISEDSMAAWLKVSTGVFGDYLMACYDPEGKPRCEDVDLELRPPLLPGLKRVWPAYEGGAPVADAGGGPMKMLGGGAPAPSAEQVIAPASHGNMWLSASNKVPGPVNLYACIDLESAPKCQLAIPDWYLIDRENIGFKKVEMDEEDMYEADGIESAIIIIEDVDEDSAADEAGFREGDKIVAVDGFRLKSDKHFKGIITQYPATYSFTVTMENGEKVIVNVRPKPKDDDDGGRR